ncbi:hypothetical protein C0039_04870 [Pseudohalioglobus lutimaris]|uniref:Major facilitator superfamily (MFS) profile domain-containing protein n=2 Tax=Pseudohalioglobus lutimaris TaxID=1737061 RepID=A0A2N5X5U9_9GAMM|nr:hypothetical protein C0039_04870 [Pseudohalioglobus lutimaris]
MGDKNPKLGSNPMRTLALAALIYAISIILIDIAPFFIGMYVDALGLTLSQAGFVQTIDQAGGILGAVAGYFMMPRYRWRSLIVAASLLATLANVLTAVADTYFVLAVVRFLSGFGVVMITTVTACILARAASPDRAFGVGLALGMFLSAVAVWLLDALRTQYGFSASLGSGALWLALGLILALFLSRELGGQSDKVEEPHLAEDISHTKATGWAALAALFLFGISVNIVYGYVERVGLANGLDQAGVANALALGFIFSAFGSTVPLIFGAVGGRLKWIAFTTLLLLASLAALYLADSVSLYTISFGLYASAWNMGLAYYMALTAENDPEEHLTRMMYIATVAAQSIGPAIAAGALTGASLSVVFVIAPAPALLAALLVSAMALRARKRSLARIAAT